MTNWKSCPSKIVLEFSEIVPHSIGNFKVGWKLKELEKVGKSKKYPKDSRLGTIIVQELNGHYVTSIVNHPVYIWACIHFLNECIIIYVYIRFIPTFIKTLPIFKWISGLLYTKLR